MGSIPIVSTSNAPGSRATGVRQYLEPPLGTRQIGQIHSESIRSWYGEVGAGSQSRVTTAKAYRLLRQILAAAVDDRVLRSNPCNLKGAAVEHSTERPILSMDDVLALAEAIKPRFRLMVLLASLVGLRRGECLALRVSDVVDREGRWTITVGSSIVFVAGVPRRELPKTDAGTRRLALPSAVGKEVDRHLAEFGLTGDDLLFADSRTGTTPTITVWRRVWNTPKSPKLLTYCGRLKNVRRAVRLIVRRTQLADSVQVLSAYRRQAVDGHTVGRVSGAPPFIRAISRSLEGVSQP